MQKSRIKLAFVTNSAPKTLEQAVQSFLTDCRCRNLSGRTVELNESLLSRLTAFLPDASIAAVTTPDLQRFLMDAMQERKPSSVQRYHEVLRAFFGWLERTEILPANLMRQVAKPKAPAPVIEPLSTEDVEALVGGCDARTFPGIRDRLLLLLLVDCGLRATEAAELETSDVDMANQLLLVRHGKGDKSRRVPFGSAVMAAAKAYLIRREGVEEPRLFINAYGQGLDRHGIRRIIVKAASRAGLERRFGPHTLRHTCAVSYLRAGGDVFSLQKILGHSDLTMTRRYTELADTDVQDKHRLFSPADRLKMPEEGKRRRLL